MGATWTCVEREGHPEMDSEEKNEGFGTGRHVFKTKNFHIICLQTGALEQFFRGPFKENKATYYVPVFAVQYPTARSQILLGCRLNLAPDLAQYRLNLFSFFGPESDRRATLEHSLNTYLTTKNAEVIGAVKDGDAHFLLFRQGQTFIDEFEVREVSKSTSAFELETYLNTAIQGKARFRFAMVTEKTCLLVMEKTTMEQAEVYVVLEVREIEEELFCDALGKRLEYTLKGRKMQLAGVITELDFPGAYLIFTYIG